MLSRSFFLILFSTGIVLIQPLSAQSYVADTIIVKFHADPESSFNQTIYVDDLREESPDFISIYEKRKWLFFPVDQIVLLDRPLAGGFEYHLSSKKGESFHLEIHEFYFDHTKSLFKRSLNFCGAFQLSRIQAPGDTILMGALYYENLTKYRKKTEIDVTYSEAVSSFESGLVRDLNVVCDDFYTSGKQGLYHFRSGSTVAPKNFYVSTDAYYGFTFWGFDAELYFSLPEPGKRFNRKSRMFRFLQYENRQSVAFSPRVSYLNYRISDRWLFQNKSAFFMGFNKWFDIDEENRTFEEIFLFQYSMMQRITFNKIDKSGFVPGIGLIEGASYVIYNKPMFNVGLVVSFAYKF